MMAARERLEGLQQQSSEDEDVTDLEEDQGTRPGSSSSLRQREAGVAQRVVSSIRQSSSSSEGESEDEDEDEGGGIHDGEEYGERDDSVHAMMGSEAGNANDIGDNSEPIQTTMMLCHRCSIFTTYDPRFPTPLQRRDKFGLQRGLRDQKLMQTPGY